ncbi:hypothetical protein DH2020_036347 [Rehmannia glutinosa]|uniref:NAD-dependent epimerase/dehydratase domain-containing protein n=1 Tax=Rehmannia glutinosa TaxID=99300 RepID=A0ABR0V3Z1_REHGL
MFGRKERSIQKLRCYLIQSSSNETHSYLLAVPKYDLCLLSSPSYYSNGEKKNVSHSLLTAIPIAELWRSTFRVSMAQYLIGGAVHVHTQLEGPSFLFSHFRGLWISGLLAYQKLLLNGYTVHATLRNLGEESKTSLLKSLPNAGTRLELFQADIYNPQEFEPAIEGCQYVLHVATPMLHTQNSKYKDTTEAAIAGVRSIAESCLRSKTVKRLVYTSSVTASSLREDGFGYKAQMDELCWTPLNLSYTYSSDFMLEYTKSKTLAEREILKYNNINGKLEVVSLVCGLVGGDTLLSYVPSSVQIVLSQLKGNQLQLTALRFLQELFGSVPLVHAEDVCDAHIFCIEKSSLGGRFLCAAESCTIEEMANFYQEMHPEFQIAEGFKSGPDGRCKCDLLKLRKEGYEFKYGLKEILNDSVECGKRLGFLRGQPKQGKAKWVPVD